MLRPGTCSDIVLPVWRARFVIRKDRGIGEHGPALGRDGGRRLRELDRVAVRDIGHARQAAFLPQQPIRKGWDLVEVDGVDDDRPAGGNEPKLSVNVAGNAQVSLVISDGEATVSSTWRIAVAGGKPQPGS